MSFDKAKPAGSTKLRLADDEIRANNDALEAAIGEGHEFATGGNQTGKHTTPTFKDNGGDPPQPTGTNEIVFYNKAGGLYSLNQAGTKRDMNPAIPAGTKMLFKQNSAPTGWTFASEDNDRVIFNTSTEADGGSIGGSWTISGCSVDNHTLSVNEMPSHRHSVTTFTSFIGTGGIFAWGDNGTTESSLTSSTGGSSGHNHGFTSNASWRPSYSKVITCSKD